MLTTRTGNREVQANISLPSVNPSVLSRDCKSALRADSRRVRSGYRVRLAVCGRNKELSGWKKKRAHKAAEASGLAEIERTGQAGNNSKQNVKRPPLSGSVVR